MTYIDHVDPNYMALTAPHCHVQVPVLSAIGKGPQGDKGDKGNPGLDSRYDFENVSLMTQESDLEVGDICHTLGFHEASDGGAAYYIITDETEANGMNIIQLNNGLFAELQITGSYVTPEMFGAWGDGINDDTLVLKKVLEINKPIYLIKTYYITDSLISNGSKNIYIYGNAGKGGFYRTSGNGFILVKDGVSVFANATIRGKIDNVGFVGEGANKQTSTTTQYMFDTCTLSTFKILNSYFYNFESIFLKTTLQEICHISENMFLSCYYFAKNETSTWHGVGDSIICNNYINGGSKYNDNVCFEWDAFPRSILYGNFIDFYWTMFDPTGKGARLNVGIDIHSYFDTYEAFRYFIGSTSFTTANVLFFNPTFTHVDENDPNIGDRLTTYEKKTIALNGTEYTIPPYLLRMLGSRQTNFYVQFIYCNFSPYTNSLNLLEASNVNGFAPFTADLGASVEFILQDRKRPNRLYNAVDNKYTVYGDNPTVIKSNLLRVLESAPSIPAGNNQYDFEVGCYYFYNHTEYLCIKYYDSGWKVGLKNMVTGNIDYHN